MGDRGRCAQTSEDTSMPKKKWPPPEFPIVEGDHLLTETWAIHLPDEFARRIEDGDLVSWRPGLTLLGNALGK